MIRSCYRITTDSYTKGLKQAGQINSLPNYQINGYNIRGAPNGGTSKYPHTRFFMVIKVGYLYWILRGRKFSPGAQAFVMGLYYYFFKN
jgi:hypothetical protein